MALNTIFVRFKCKQKSGNTDCKHTDKWNLRRLERICDKKHSRENGQQKWKDVFNKEKAWRTLNVVYNSSALENDIGHFWKVGIHQNNLRRLWCCFTARSHCNTAIGVFHCENIVYAVTCHGNGVACLLESLNKFLLLLWRNSAENGVLNSRLLDFFVCIKEWRIDIFIRICNACLLCNLGNGFWAVARDNLNGNILLVKILKCFYCAFTNRVWKDNESERLCHAWIGLFGKEQNTIAFFGKRSNFACDGLKIIFHNKLGCAENECAVAECDCAELICWRKRLNADSSALIIHTVCIENRGVILDCQHSCIVIDCSCSVIDKQALKLLGCNQAVVETVNIVNCHIRLCNCTRFINTKDIYTRKRLDAFHIVKKNFLLSEPDCAERKRNCCEHIKPLGNHTCDCGNGRNNARFKGFVINPIALIKENQSDWDNCNTHPFNDLVDWFNHFGLLTGAHLFCLLGELINICLLADIDKPCTTLTRNYEAARHKRWAADLFDFIGLTGQKSLVDLYISADYNCIGTDLVPCRENNNIVLYKLFCGNFDLSAGANSNSMRRIENTHFFKRFLCSNLLKNSDKRVADNYGKESEISERSDNTQKNGDYEEYKVEICECIWANNFLNRFIGWNLRFIDKTGVFSCGDLVFIKTHNNIVLLLGHFIISESETE